MTYVTFLLTNPPASQVTTHNRFTILETTEDAMDIIEAVNTQHTQKKTPPPPPIFIDDVIDIHTDSKHEYKTPDNKRKLNNTGS